MEMRLGVIGKVLDGGRYEGWRLIVNREKSEFKGNPVENYHLELWLIDGDTVVEAYDTHFPDCDSLVLNMEKWFKGIEWLDEDPALRP